MCSAGLSKGRQGLGGGLKAWNKEADRHLDGRTDGLSDGRTEGQTDGRKFPPLFYRKSSPLGPLPKKYDNAAPQ